MNPSLREFSGRFLDKVLALIWGQWTALGVSGQASGDDPRLIDPEALLLATCGFGRHEPRLFDEALDCLQENGWAINTQRLSRLLRDEKWSGGPVLKAVAGLLGKGRHTLKWRRLSEHPSLHTTSQELFRLKDGRPSPVVGEPEPHFAAYGFRRGPLRLRGHSQPFRPFDRRNLVLQLRALCGVNVRAEVIAYLLTHEVGHPVEIAREACYHKRTVQDVLVEMNRSGVVDIRPSGREKHYWLRTDEWRGLLQRPDALPRWVSWPPYFSAIERIWRGIHDPKLDGLDPLALSSALRRLMVEVRPSLERAGIDKVLSDDRRYLGKKYLPVFFADVSRLLD